MWPWRRGERVERLDPLQPLVAEAVAVAGEARSLGGRLAAAVLAGEQAALEREERDVADPELAADRHHLGVVVAPHQAVVVLHRHDLGDPGRLPDLRRVDVREAEPPHLALVDELLHRGDRLRDRRHAVGAVVVVEVDGVGAEALERGVDRAPHVVARAGRPVAVSALHVVPELRREDDAVAPARERLAEEALAVAAPAVDVGRVEEGDPRVERRVHDRARGGGVEPPAEVVAPEPDARDLEIGAAEARGHHQAGIMPTRGSRLSPSSAAGRRGSRRSRRGSWPARASRRSRSRPRAGRGRPRAA